MFDNSTTTTETEQQILTALSGGPLTSTQIATQIGRKPNETRPRLSELFKAGRVRREGEAPPFVYSLAQPAYPTPTSQPSPLQPQSQESEGGTQKEPGEGPLPFLQDTSLLFGPRRRASVPLPARLLDQLEETVIRGRLKGRLCAPDQCDYLALGALLVLRILEEGGNEGERLRQILTSMREETRGRQAKREG